MTPGLKSPVQTVLILLVESGLVCLGFQVSDSHIPAPHTSAQELKALTALTDSVLGVECVLWQSFCRQSVWL